MNKEYENYFNYDMPNSDSNIEDYISCDADEEIIQKFVEANRTDFYHEWFRYIEENAD